MAMFVVHYGKSMTKIDYTKFLEMKRLIKSIKKIYSWYT